MAGASGLATGSAVGVDVGGRFGVHPLVECGEVKELVASRLFEEGGEEFGVG